MHTKWAAASKVAASEENPAELEENIELGPPANTLEELDTLASNTKLVYFNYSDMNIFN